jgi:type II secretory pathway pseudopilin PulG
MELLVVMAIMLALSTILVAGYFGMTRAASYTAAETDVYNLLQLARQRACMDGTKVFFVLIDNQSCVLVHGVGQVTGLEPNLRLYDAYADHHTVSTPESGGTHLRLWNMDDNGMIDDATIDYKPKEEVVAGSLPPEKFIRTTCVIEGRFSGSWKIGDHYGFELYPRQILPKGFYFGVPGRGSDPNFNKLTFNPDGSPEGTLKFRIYEKIAAEARDTLVNIMPDGSITLKKP